MPEALHDLPAALRSQIQHAGYYPDLVTDVLDVAVGGEPVVAHFVHAETTFDADVRRHITAFALTPTRFVAVHADDHAPDGPDGPPHPYATASSEAVPIAAIRSVVVNHVVPRPEGYRSGSGTRDLTLTIGWGAVSRLDLQPAGCADPDCEADHGHTGTVSADDVSIRVSVDADGPQVVRAALDFARALSAATGPGLSGA
ncbi:MAG: DUF5998 family protein [Angustibacter sp.]